MKKTTFISFLLVLCFTGISTIAFSNVLNLNEALKTKKVNCVIHGNSASTHYLEPIVVELSNVSNDPLSVSIEDGDMFIPSDTAKQNIVVTAQSLIVLQPKEKKAVKIKGMCTEQSDGSGNDETVYTFQAVGNTKLKELAAFIESQKYQSSAAQYAVWSLMGGNDLNSIYSSDTIEEDALKKFMSTLTGKTFALRTKDYRYNYYTPPTEKVGGNFGFNISKSYDVQIAMFDKNGILVRELFNQKKVTPGEHTFNFEFDSAVYTDAIYYFKLIVGNEVMVDRMWDVQTMRDSFKKKIETGIQGHN